jgi:pimeloyl-ACP methyl ester carboxylesterase
MVFVDGLVTAPNLGPANGPQPAQQLAGEAGLKAREGIIRGMFSASTTPDMQKHILAMMLGAPEVTAVGAMYATMDPAIWKGDVFTQPVLGLYADKSALGNREYMKAHFPNLQYVEIAGTGHFLMIEKPDEFNHLLLGFLSKQTF